MDRETHTVGIENSNGTIGLEVFYNGESRPDNGGDASYDPPALEGHGVEIIAPSILPYGIKVVNQNTEIQIDSTYLLLDLEANSHV